MFFHQKFVELNTNDYFCNVFEDKWKQKRGATAIADAENRPMEPETDNADAGMIKSIHKFFHNSIADGYWRVAYPFSDDYYIY